MMNFKILSPFALLLLFALGACDSRNSRLQGSMLREEVYRTVLLSDSIPKKTFEQLAINDVRGYGVMVADHGKDVRYFGYAVEAERLLEALRLSPFEIHADSSDVNYYEIDQASMSKYLATIPDEERQAYPFFFQTDDTDRVYAITRPPLHHLVVVKSDGKVMHRIEREI